MHIAQCYECYVLVDEIYGSDIPDICHFKNKTIMILNPQCYECTSIGYDDEPGGNCSDSQPGGKVGNYCTIVFVATIAVFVVFGRNC